MNQLAGPAAISFESLPRVPSWALPRAFAESDFEAAFMAGAALNSLDSLVRLNSPWLGAWRQRLALKAAAACLKLMRRPGDEMALRDAWYLRRPGDSPGPAGDVFLAWRRLAGRGLPPTIEDVCIAADLLGVGRPAFVNDLLENVRADLNTGTPAPLVAARTAATVMRADPRAEVLAWWMADLSLSWRMGWPHGVPLLSGQIQTPVLRAGPDRRRSRPDGPEFERAACLAAAAGAAEACRLASGIARQSERLLAAQAKLRSKGAGDIIKLLLSDDAVSGSFTSKAMTRWASRRLFERLLKLGAVRELSGRDTFRLYGL